MAAISVPCGSILSSHRVTHTLRMSPRNFERFSSLISMSLEDKSTGSEMVQHLYISRTPVLISPKESVQESKMAAISVPCGSILSSRRVTHTLHMSQRNFFRFSSLISMSLEDKSTGSEMVQHSYISGTPVVISPKESVGSETLHAYISTNPLPIPPTNKSFNMIPFLAIATFSVKVLGNKVYADVYNWLCAVFNKRTGTYNPFEDSTSAMSSRDCVLVAPIEEKTTNNYPAELQRGHVVAIGWRNTRSIFKWNSHFVEHDKEVIFPRSVCTLIENEECPHILLKENQILGLLETPNIEDIRPLEDRVLIKFYNFSPTSEGPFHNHFLGKVTAVGSGIIDRVGRHKVIKLTRGQFVVFFKTGLEEFENENYILIRANQIVLVG